MSFIPGMEHLPKSLVRALHALMLGSAGLLLALHFVHLAADFPNNSPWMDWSKYTDEGWYGDAAIRHFQLGHWYVPGDFNPAAALPVWPLLESGVFHFTGVSLVAARALTVCVFAGIVVASWFLLSRWRPRPQMSLAASASALLLAASPFCLVFTRLAILEPLLVLLVLLALLAAGTVKLDPPGGMLRANLLPILGLAVLLPAIILTKTTGLFLVPAIAFLLLAGCGYRMRPFFQIGLPAAGLGFALWLLWFELVIRPHFLLDYRYLFSANAYTGITPDNYVQVLTDTFKDGMWMGRILYPAALLAALWAVVSFRRLRAHPLIPALLLWAGGYTAFLAYHDNLQPRYYLVVAIPLTLLVPAVLEQLVLAGLRAAWVKPLVLASAGLTLAIAVPDARESAHFLRHPDYTLLEAAREVRDYIAHDRQTDPGHNPLLLSISGSDISLMTGLPSICDDFGTLELPDRVKRYRPGWYAAWNQLDDDKMDAMTPLFHPQRVAAFPAMDDPDRNLLILYKLDPAEPTEALHRKGKPTPRQLKTKVGQQPSVEQLEH